MHFGGLEISLRQQAAQMCGIEPTPIVMIPRLLQGGQLKYVKIPCVAGLVRRLLYQTTTAGIELTDGSECPVASGGGGVDGPPALQQFATTFRTAQEQSVDGTSAAAMAHVSFCIHRDVFEKYPFVLEAGTGLVVRDVTALYPPLGNTPCANISGLGAIVIVCLRNVHAVFRCLGDSGGIATTASAPRAPSGLSLASVVTSGHPPSALEVHLQPSVDPFPAAHKPAPSEGFASSSNQHAAQHDQDDVDLLDLGDDDL